MTKPEAKAIFEETILPEIKDDGVVAIRCTWNDFVDELNKEGKITNWQAFNWVNPYDK